MVIGVKADRATVSRGNCRMAQLIRRSPKVRHHSAIEPSASLPEMFGGKT
jgi:hypothetical protein